MSTMVAFEPFSCGENWKNTQPVPSNNELRTPLRAATYVHSDAGELKDLGVGILARCVAVEFHLAAIELNGVQGCLFQLVIAPQGHRLTPSNRRWLHQQIHVTQRRLPEIWKAGEIHYSGCGVITVGIKCTARKTVRSLKNLAKNISVL